MASATEPAKVWGTELNVSANNTTLTQLDGGIITVSVNCDADRLRLFVADDDVRDRIIVISENSAANVGKRMDFPEKNEWAADRYYDFPVGTVDAPTKINLKAVNIVKGQVSLNWIDNDGELVNFTGGVASLSYNEYSNGTQVGVKRGVEFTGGETYMDYYVLEGNTVGFTAPVFTDDDKSYFFANKYQWVNDTTKMLDSASASFGISLIDPSTADEGKLALLYNRYQLAKYDGSKGLLSTDSIFKIKNESGKPVISADTIYASGYADSAALYDSLLTTWYVNDLSKSGSYKYDKVLVHAKFYNDDPSKKVSIASATWNGATCDVHGSWTNGVGDNNFTIAVPKSAIKSAFEKAANAKLDPVDMSFTFEEAPVDVAFDYSDVSWHGDTDSATITIDNGTSDIWNESYSEWQTKYGRTAHIVVEPVDGYKVVSVNVTQNVVNNGKVEEDVNNWWEDADVKTVTTDGKTFTVGLDTEITVWTEKDLSFKVFNNPIDPDTEIKETTKGSGEYAVEYNKKPVWIQLFEGTTQKNIVSFNAFNGDTEIYEGSVIKKDSGLLWFDGSKVSGNTITVKFTGETPTGFGLKGVDESKIKTAKLVVDTKDSKTVSLKDSKIQKNGDKFPVGATRIYDLVIGGNVDINAKLDKAATGVSVTYDSDKKQVKVVTTASTDAEYKGKVIIYDVNETSNELCTFDIAAETDTVKVAKPFTAKVVGKSNNSIGISLAINKKISNFFIKNSSGEVTDGINGLYYMINVKGDKAPSTTKLKQEVTEFVDASATFAEISLANGTLTGTDLYLGDDSVNWTVTVTLIQTKAAAPTTSNWDSGSNKVMASDPVEIKNVKTGAGQNFATKVTLKSTGADKKLYSNMGATNNYAISIGYNNGCGVQMVSKVELLNKKGEIIATVNRGETDGSANMTYSGGGLLAANNQTIKIYPAAVGNLEKGKYTVKAYAVEPLGYEVVGKFTLNVVEAIESLRAVPETDRIWKTSGKAASIKMPAYDQNGKAVTGKKVTYAVIDGSGAYTWNDPSTYPQKLAVTSAVTVKNGKITVNKSFTPTGKLTDNEFRVIVMANDYKGNTVHRVIGPIRVMNVGSVALTVINSKSHANDTKTKPAGSVASTYDSVEKFYYDLRSEVAPFAGSVNEKQLFKYRYATELTVYDADDSFDGVAGNGHTVNFKYSIGGAKVIKYTPAAIRTGQNVGKVVIATNKPGKVTIGGSALDLSKRTLPGKKLTVNVGYNTGKVRYALYGYDKDGTFNKIVSSNAFANELKGFNYGPSEKTLTLRVFGEKDDDCADWYAAQSQLVDVTKIKATNAKVKLDTTGMYTITPTATDVTIEIVTKSNGSAKFSFKNPAIIKGGKAAKITASNVAFGKADAKGKIYSMIDIPAANYGTGNNKMNPNTVKYSVDFSKLAVAGTKQVMISLIKDDENYVGASHDFRAALNEYGKVNGKNTTTAGKNFYVVDLTSGALPVFNFSDQDVAGGAHFDVKPGTYVLGMTPGFTKDGVFNATGKSVQVKVAAAKAPKASVKPVATLNFGAGGKTPAVAFDFSKSKNFFNDGAGAAGIRMKTDVIIDGVAVTKYHAGINTKGTINNFGSAFDVIKDGSAYKLKFVGTNACKEINPKTQKVELSGWVLYQWRNLDGTLDQKWVKVNVKTTGNLTR